jgi:hypothetical protein
VSSHPLSLKPEERLELGLRAADGRLYQQDKVWSRHSNDKIDIAGTLARVLRTLSKALPLDQPLTALSIGSSNEPQFRLLESFFRGGLYLLDIEQAALDVVAERIQRQQTNHVRTLHGDYRFLLHDDLSRQRFRDRQLDGIRPTLITLHHSLYYTERSAWRELLVSLYQDFLPAAPQPGPSGAIHAVLMASQSEDLTTTTGLYNYFASQFFGHRNDQDLLECAEELRQDPRLADAQILNKRSRVEFFVDDFGLFMSVVWMILLHPDVHPFSTTQQQEVIEFVYQQLWSRRRPLVQQQDHLVIYRGKGVAGLI